MDATIVEWMAANLEEARELSQYLIEKRLAACINIIPNVRSLYMWEGKLEESREWKVSIKTLAKHFDSICSSINRIGSYEVNAIVQMPVTHIDAGYIKWMHSSIN